MEGSSFFQRLKSGLTKSRENWAQKIGAIFQNRQWDERSLDTMEENLIAADLGPKATQKLMDLLRQQSPGGAEDLRARKEPVRKKTAQMGEAVSVRPKRKPASEIRNPAGR